MFLCGKCDYICYVLISLSLSLSLKSWGINKLFGLKDAIKPIAQRLCYLVGQEELNSTLVQLKLVEPTDLFEEKPTPTVPSLPALSPGKVLTPTHLINYYTR